MCDLNHHHEHGDFGFIVDVPEIRALIDETRRLASTIREHAARVEALRPAFARLLAADGWLPDQFAQPDATSGMGGGIGQYALYRDEAGSLCLFSLVVPPGSRRPCTTISRGASSASIAAHSSTPHMRGWMTGVTRRRRRYRSRAGRRWALVSFIRCCPRRETFTT